jgi:thiol-disulfide isomerase/thioredoxin
MARVIILTLLLLLSPVAATAQGAKAPALVLRDLRRRTLRVGDYKGKIVLLNFWATWCPPCRAEMPDLVKWQRQYRSGGLQVIGITYPPARRAAVRNFTRRIGINYPVVFGAKETKALFDSGEALPLSVIIDREGNVRDVIRGIILPEEFEQKVKPLLDNKAAVQRGRRAARNPQAGDSDILCRLQAGRAVFVCPLSLRAVAPRCT